MFQTGSNTWRAYDTWPVKGATPTNLYLRTDGTLSFDKPTSAATTPYREYVSDPASPVPYRQRPISPTYPNGDWRRWEVADQRFVEGRPDVLTYTSAPLDADVTITGALSATLFASTSGTDADFVVKLIDVYPENAQPNAWSADAGPAPGAYARSLNGYQLPIAMEVRRGRFNASFETPHPLVPNKPTEWTIPLREHDHVFPQRASHHGAGAIHLVPGDRSQSAEIRAEHLQREGVGLREGDATRVRVAGASVAHRATGGAEKTMIRP